MKKKVFSIILIVTILMVYLFANNSFIDLPPGVTSENWIKITDNFGIHIQNSAKKTSEFEKYIQKPTSSYPEKNIIDGKYMAKKNGVWYVINSLPKVPSIIPVR